MTTAIEPTKEAESRWRLTAAGYLAGLGGVALFTAILAPVREHLGLASIALIFLAGVALIASRWGWGPGLATCVAANLSYNFFFVPPLYRFTVQEPSNVIALLVFLFVAALTSTLLARARAGEAKARRHQQETAVLYDLSRLIVADIDLPSTLTSVCSRVCETFGARSCLVLLFRDGELQPAASAGEPDTAPVSADERHAAATAMSSSRRTALGSTLGQRLPRIVGITGRDEPVVYVPLRVGGRSVGVLRVTGRLKARVFAGDELRLLEAFADEAAPAVERDRLLHEAARAEALLETDRLKSALLSAVSHDLRTPLASIKASVSSLLQDEVPWDAATRREFLTAIDEETDRLTRLVNNLLDLSRIEGGALRPDIDWYDVGELLETAVARLSRSITHHPIRLKVEPDTGAAPIDYVHITQVATNLVENAAKFSPAGTPIEVSAHRDGDDVIIEVVDHGPGIPAAERERVFDKFYRVARDGHHAPGTGLGLAISKGLVEAHGGRIWVDDAPGGGARFVVRLPAPSRPAEPAPPDAPASVPASPVGAGVDSRRPTAARSLRRADRYTVRGGVGRQSPDERRPDEGSP